MIAFLAITVTGLIVAGMIAQRHNAGEIRRAVGEFRRLGCAGGGIPILMPVCGRPHYLRQVLEALSRVKDIDQTLLIFSQDGRNAEVSALIAGIGFTKVIVIRHARPFLGIFAFFWDSLHAVSVNIRFLLDFAFDHAGARGAIVLEDDIVPSPDFIRFFSWAFRHILTDERVMSVTGFNLHSRISPGQDFDPRDYPGDMVENRDNGRPRFTGWGWAITRAMWRRIRADWSPLSWDIRLDATQRKMGLISYKPVLGRAMNIGMQGGINFTESEGNPLWTGIVLAEGACPDDVFPRLLSEDPVLPPLPAAPPNRTIPNERQRTRIRRLWLYTALVVMTALELFILGYG